MRRFAWAVTAVLFCCADSVFAQSYSIYPDGRDYYAVASAMFRGELVAQRTDDPDVPPPPIGYAPEPMLPDGEGLEFDVQPEPGPIAEETLVPFEDYSVSCGGKSSCSSCKSGGWTLTGWLNGGATYNADGPASRFNGPVTFNDRYDGGFNQAYVVLEKRAVSDGCGWDIGGRIDVLYGSDYVFVENVGVELDDNGNPHWNSGPRYGLALPQFYAEVAGPILSVKAGMFNTLLGYETLQAPNNFFYSHSYHKQYGEPFQHAGILGTLRSGTGVELTGGVVNGWGKLDAEEDRAAVLIGMNYRPCHERFALSTAVITGEEDGTIVPVAGHRTLYSVVLSVNLGCNLQYVVQHDHGWQENGVNGNETAEWYGVNNYLFYHVNDCWQFGVRGEWFRDDDGTRVTGIRQGNPNAGPFAGNFYEVSAGFNWRPTCNLRFRPEVRWDWFDGVGRPFDDGNEASQFLAAIDGIFLF